jgi:hypothetical protein
MEFAITLVPFILLATWAILRTIGGERERRLTELRNATPPAKPAPETSRPPAAASQPPHRKAA